MGRVTGFRVQGKPKAEDCDLTYPHKLFVVVVDKICQYFGCFVVRQLIQRWRSFVNLSSNLVSALHDQLEILPWEHPGKPWEIHCTLRESFGAKTRIDLHLLQQWKFAIHVFLVYVSLGARQFACIVCYGTGLTGPTCNVLITPAFRKCSWKYGHVTFMHCENQLGYLGS